MKGATAATAAILALHEASRATQRAAELLAELGHVAATACAREAGGALLEALGKVVVAECDARRTASDAVADVIVVPANADAAWWNRLGAADSIAYVPRLFPLQLGEPRARATSLVRDDKTKVELDARDWRDARRAYLDGYQFAPRPRATVLGGGAR